MNQIKLLIFSAFVLSLSFASAQEADDEPKNAVLIDFAQPLIGQVQVGVLLNTNSEFDFFVFGRYNFNYVPNNIEYSYYYFGPTIQKIEYRSYNAKESGYTIGGQIRRTIHKEDKEELEYKKYLKPNTSKAIGYYGAWLEIGNSVSVDKDPYFYNVDGNVPDATLKWTNISGGLLTGFKSNLTKSLLLDIYGGLGYRSTTVEVSEPGVEDIGTTNRRQYSGVMHVSNYNRGIVTARLGIQLGYKF